MLISMEFRLIYLYVNDDDGAPSNEATVTINVNAVNDAPVLQMILQQLQKTLQ